MVNPYRFNALQVPPRSRISSNGHRTACGTACALVSDMSNIVHITFVLGFVGACSHNVYTPPSRPMVLTSPDTVETGETTLRATGSTSSDLFGPSILAGSVGARHGLDDRLEVVGDASFAQVIEASASGTNRGVAMARGGVKYRPTMSPHLAIVSGVGGGYAPAAGSYLSADFGAVVGYENKYVVPFVSASAFGSVPLNPRTVNTTIPADTETFEDTPRSTVGLVIGAGLKVPIQTSAVLVGFTNTQLRDSDSSDSFMSLGATVEHTF